MRGLKPCDSSAVSTRFRRLLKAGKHSAQPVLVAFLARCLFHFRRHPSAAMSTPRYKPVPSAGGLPSKRYFLCPGSSSTTCSVNTTRAIRLQNPDALGHTLFGEDRRGPASRRPASMPGREMPVQHRNSTWPMLCAPSSEICSTYKHSTKSMMHQLNRPDPLELSARSPAHR